MTEPQRAFGTESVQAVTEGVYTDGYKVPSLLAAIAQAATGTSVPPETIRVKRRVNEKVASVIALTPSHGNGTSVMLYEHGDIERRSIRFTAKYITPAELREYLLIAADALRTSQEIIDQR